MARLGTVTLLLALAAPALTAQELPLAELPHEFVARCHEVRAALDSLRPAGDPGSRPHAATAAGDSPERRDTAQDPAAVETRHRKLRTTLDPLHSALLGLTGRGGAAGLAPRACADLANPFLPIVERWIDLADPRNSPSDLRACYPGFADLLAAHDDARERRRFLNRVVEHDHGTPGTSDLDLLCRAIEWDALFLRCRAAGSRQLRALSADLILLFTERGPDGLRRSGAGLYRSGRTRDRGLRASLRDGGDQVRHFCWALRMFATSPAPALTERLLGAKELRDAVQHGGGDNACDRRLNRAARELVAEILGAPAPGSAGAPAGPRSPLPVESYAELVRQRLGPAAATER